MHQVEAVSEREVTTPNPYGDLDPAVRTALEERIRQPARDTDPRTGWRRNRHERRKAAALERKR